MEGDKKNLHDLLHHAGYEEDDEPNIADNLVETSKEVRKRVCALKKLQMESVKVESKFYERVHLLEKEFQPLFDEINKRRAAIISGQYEPTESECNVPLIHGASAELLKKLDDEAPVEGTPSKGVPEFWYHALNNVAQIGDMIHEHDVPILKHLQDITADVHTEPAGFTLNFHFAPNDHFTNTVLSKYYELQIQPTDDEIFDYEGPMVIRAKGCQIDWKENMNVTKKVIKKKQKKGSGAGRFITKTVRAESFFNFFDPVAETLKDLDDATADNLRTDFEIGQLIRDQVIPRAVLFYTGEAADEFDEFDDDEDEDMGEGSEMDSGEDWSAAHARDSR